jgi:hypothetical protein
MATTLQRMPVGEVSALPEAVHSAAATAMGMMPLTSVVVMTVLAEVGWTAVARERFRRVWWTHDAASPRASPAARA